MNFIWTAVVESGGPVIDMSVNVELSDISDLILPDTRDVIANSKLPPLQAWLDWVQHHSNQYLFEGYGLQPQIVQLFKQGAARRFRTEHPFDVVTRFICGRMTRDSDRLRFTSVQHDEWVQNDLSDGRQCHVYLSSSQITDLYSPETPPHSDPVDGYIDLYHGTSEHSAVAICQQGVSIQAGRVPADYGQGFYLGSKQIAFNRAVAIATDLNDNVAVLQWKVHESDLQQLLPHLILKEPDHDWENLVRYFRLWGRNDQVEIDEIVTDSVDNLHYIHGPILANVTEVEKGPIPVQLSNGEIPMQWSFHSEHAAQLLNQCHVQVVLYRLPLVL